MNIILSTRNPSKKLQIQGIFNGSHIRVLSLDDAKIDGEVVEDGITLHQNALKKAQFAWDQSEPGDDNWAMADDTGIFIAALDGEPGVKAARWAGETATTNDIMQFTLGKLKGVKDRSAVFKTVVALIAPTGKIQYFDGAVAGKLLEAPRCEPQPKMPYSPIFMPNGQEMVWGEMTTEEENEISHRGIAFRKVRKFLESVQKK